MNIHQKLTRIAAICSLTLLIPAPATFSQTAPEQINNKLESGKLQLKETSSSIVIQLGGKPLLTYNKSSLPLPQGTNPAYHRSGFLHPVSSPAGFVVTDALPADHPHQNGIFTAWVTTKWNDRSIDFWNLAGGTGRVLHERVAGTFLESNKIGFEVDLIHRAEQAPVVDILRERWKVTAWETDGSFFQFDLETTQRALTDSPLIIEKYHYGGVAYRGPVRWLVGKEESGRKDPQSNEPREPFEFLNDQGADRVQGNSQHSRWVAATGQINGQQVSIIVLSHKNNFRAPQAARLHPTKPYFVFSPCIDGQFVIDREHDYTATYRYLITDARPNSQWINQQWNQWHGE